MLVLGRKTGQAIVIGDQITIRILKHQGQYVRIGIDAPSDIRVHRQEIYEKIQRQEILNQPLVENDM